MNPWSRRSFLSAAGALSMPRLSRPLQTAVSPYRRPKLKIKEIKWTYVRTHGNPCHVRIYTDQGIYGHGECTDSAQGASAIIDSFKRTLYGQDPLNVDALWERMRPGVLEALRAALAFEPPKGLPGADKRWLLWKEAAVAVASLAEPDDDCWTAQATLTSINLQGGSKKDWGLDAFNAAASV